ncbi:MAG: hypothetical protein UX39_C0019G0009, partial [Candidatus Magasanikbacteria bacterium GW2011_GWA2_46_17]
LALFISAFLLSQRTDSAPLLANYFLGTLPTDMDAISKLARNDVLILSPEQAVARREVITVIKRLNPDIILLAYVPSQSYNMVWQQYPGNLVYRDFAVRDDWWLRDSAGNITSDWPGLKNTNLSQEYADYLLSFVESRILPQGIWNGIFWDMVNDGISHVNRGDVDLNRDGARDDAQWVNSEWMRRMNYLLQSSQRLPARYILINGTSLPLFQDKINGRMYEDFPTPWESGGWSGIMTGLERTRGTNRAPRLYVFNANTNNSGRRNDYRRMRFGLASSLMADDVYFSFDYGTRDHAQVWWYDEYEVNLGRPTGQAVSLNNAQRFQEDVWKREYERGIALTNSTGERREVELGAEYEKIRGRQDPTVNDGSITDRVTIQPRDGLIMLKTAQTIDDVVYANGGFLRFYDLRGSRARNGFFAYDNSIPGGAKVFFGDLDGNGDREKIIARGARLEIFNSRGEHWFDDYPYGANFRGEIRMAVGKLQDQNSEVILIAPSAGGELVLYTFYGELIKRSMYPLGKKYRGGFSVAIRDATLGAKGEAMLGTGQGRSAEVLVVDDEMRKIKNRFFPYGKNLRSPVLVAAGDINGDGRDEIVTVATVARRSVAKIFGHNNTKISEFAVSSVFGSRVTTLGIADVTFDGVGEIVAGSN